MVNNIKALVGGAVGEEEEAAENNAQRRVAWASGAGTTTTGTAAEGNKVSGITIVCLLFVLKGAPLQKRVWAGSSL